MSLVTRSSSTSCSRTCSFGRPVRVGRLELIDFRNYERAVLELDAGTTVFLGSNGQGKTNLVESVVVLASGSSHRVAGDEPLVRQGAASAIIRSELHHGERMIAVDVQLQRAGANRAQANGRRIPMRDLPRYAQVVLFAPEDLALVRGEPSGRRSFLDRLAAQRLPRMAAVQAEYEKLVRQRNALLKSARMRGVSAAESASLTAWNERLVMLGLEIANARADLVQELQPLVAAAYAGIAGEEQQVALALETNVPGSAEEFHAALAARQADECERGVSLVGPHRDDLALQLNGLLARQYASHGESWSMALALKLAAAQLLRQESSAGDPVVILDDVFAELDAARRERLVTAVHDFEQVLVTAAVEGDVPQSLTHRTVRIRRGEVVGA